MKKIRFGFLLLPLFISSGAMATGSSSAISSLALEDARGNYLVEIREEIAFYQLKPIRGCGSKDNLSDEIQQNFVMAVGLKMPYAIPQLMSKQGAYKFLQDSEKQSEVTNPEGLIQNSVLEKFIDLLLNVANGNYQPKLSGEPELVSFKQKMEAIDDDLKKINQDLKAIFDGTNVQYVEKRKSSEVPGGEDFLGKIKFNYFNDKSKKFKGMVLISDQGLDGNTMVTQNPRISGIFHLIKKQMDLLCASNIELPASAPVQPN